MHCPKCKKETHGIHEHDTAHGIPDCHSSNHMSGSERYRCGECGYIMFKKEAEKQGLEFTLD